MRVDFLNPSVIFKQSKNLNLNLSAEEANEIFNRFNLIQEDITITPEALRSSAKNLNKASGGKIKLNHALEIMSREFFNLPWHTALTKLEREAKEKRIKDIMLYLENIETSHTREYLFFIPGILQNERSLIRQHSLAIKIIDNIANFHSEIIRIHDEFLLREYHDKNVSMINIIIPYFVEFSAFWDKMDDVQDKFKELLRAGRSKKIIFGMATSRSTEIIQSERMPDKYKIK
jgi:hypothetical protein